MHFWYGDVARRTDDNRRTYGIHRAQFFRRAKSPETNDQVEKYKPLNEDQTD
jgi:hypothetical protein